VQDFVNAILNSYLSGDTIIIRNIPSRIEIAFANYVSLMEWHSRDAHRAFLRQDSTQPKGFVKGINTTG
jgi:hypothetical protein